MENRLCVDDPVAAFPTHGLASVWGLIATGLFCERTPQFADHSGLFKGGTWKFLGVQILSCACITFWVVITTFIQLYFIDKLFGLRMSDAEEEVGADYYVHNIGINGTGSSPKDDPTAENENDKIDESQEISSACANNEVQRTQQNFDTGCPPVDSENLREINSRHSPGKREMRNMVNGGNNNEIRLTIVPYLKRHASSSKERSNFGYHSS